MRRATLYSRSGHVAFVMDNMALGQDFVSTDVSPVSIIPPLLHTHPFIYHPRYIMFFSQHSSFPLSVSFHHCSILIHPSTTHTVQCFSPSTSVFPVSIIPPLLHTCLHPHVVPTRRSNGQSVGTFQKAMSFCKSACNGQESSFSLFTFKLELFYR